MTHWIRNYFNRLKSCNCTIVLCVVLYIFVCLFGNIITGIFINYHRLKEDDHENVAETILTTLDTSKDKDFDFDNYTFDFSDILATLEEDGEDTTESFGSVSVDRKNNVRYYQF